MPSWRSLVPSRYFKKDDFDTPKILTLAKIALQENVAMEDEEEKLRPVAYFEGHKQGLVLNVTNLESMGEIAGSEDYETWIGKQFELFHDPKVSFGGKKVGGIRVREPEIPFVAVLPLPLLGMVLGWLA